MRRRFERPLQDRATQASVAQGLRSDDPNERYVAVWALERPGGDDAVAMLIAALQDPQIQLDKAKIRVIAESCIRQATLAELSSADCGRPGLPIFVPGSEHPEATSHVAKALVHSAAWVKLRFLHKPEDTHGRRWYAKHPQTDPALDQTIKCSGILLVTACDEYPFWMTEEGGEMDPGGNLRLPSELPHLELIDFAQNSGQGSRFGHFAEKCKLQVRRTSPPQFGLGYFLVVPVPVVPTQALCNGSNRT